MKYIYSYRQIGLLLTVLATALSFILFTYDAKASSNYDASKLDSMLMHQSDSIDKVVNSSQPKLREKGSVSVNSLQGDTYVWNETTSNRSPVIYGLIPTYCYSVGVAIFTDTANFDTGDGIYLFISEEDSIWVEDGYPSDYRGWALDLSANGLGLINGKYNVYVSSHCELSSYDYSNPLFADIFMDAISIVPNGCDSTCTPVHRFYNTQNGAHFYTTTEHEKRDVLEMPIYRYEGISSFARTSGGNVSVHRFYNFKNGTHFYTGNQSEASYINANLGHTYRYEGVSYSAYTYQASNSSPVHRFYKFKQGVHFYTANQAEASTVNNTASGTYRYEGISYYLINN